jgi:hypothetical protein
MIPDGTRRKLNENEQKFATPRASNQCLLAALAFYNFFFSRE